MVLPDKTVKILKYYCIKKMKNEKWLDSDKKV